MRPGLLFVQQGHSGYGAWQLAAFSCSPFLLVFAQSGIIALVMP
jgi:hypothetical protein